MQTNFTLAQLADPDVRAADGILRTCVHCGFCTATCPTYVLLGDERDSPRGRIILIKEMLEADRPATAITARHIDRCLSCLACATTCPSGVDYMHLVDLARDRIERTFRRPWHQRWQRWALARVLPHPGRFRAALALGRLVKPLAPLLPRRARDLLTLVPATRRSPSATLASPAAATMRVALAPGCVQPVIAPAYDAAARRLLVRLGAEVVEAPGAGCCGALVHHLGRRAEARSFARRNVRAWQDLALDAIVATASGCGTMVKDYGHVLADDAAWAEPARRVASLARDVTEVVARLTNGAAPRGEHTGTTVAYHAACSLQHGQKITALPRRLLAEAGFIVREVAEGHLCCGSAGTYNLTQPALAGALRARKAANIRATGAAIVAAGNVGCIAQLEGALDRPIVHTVELLDWAWGGPRPTALGR
jgi:glycolate oxidase iron-sulfur subunit